MVGLAFSFRSVVTTGLVVTIYGQYLATQTLNVLGGGVHRLGGTARNKDTVWKYGT